MARTATVNELYDINLAIIDAGKEFLADNDAAAYQKNIRNFRIPLPPCRTQSHQKIWGGATALGERQYFSAKYFSAQRRAVSKGRKCCFPEWPADQLKPHLTTLTSS
jgi:hypothetical protein